MILNTWLVLLNENILNKEYLNFIIQKINLIIPI